MGKPGVKTEGLAPVIARARSRPDFMCPMTEGTVANINCSCPLISPFSAGAPPLYPMRTIFTPAMDLNNSPRKMRWKARGPTRN